jgi:hypothetical protein
VLANIGPTELQEHVDHGASVRRRCLFDDTLADKHNKVSTVNRGPALAITKAKVTGIAAAESPAATASTESSCTLCWSVCAMSRLLR